MNDLFYQGVNNLTIDDEEAKKQREIERNKKVQSELYTQGLYPQGTTEDAAVDGIWGPQSKAAFSQYQDNKRLNYGRNEAIQEIQSNVATDEIDTNTLSEEELNLNPGGDPGSNYGTADYNKENNKPLTYEQWLVETGQDQLPELQPYYDEKRESRANKQQNAYNFATALRSLGQAGFAGDNAMFAQKFAPDRTTPRLQRELQRVRDAGDADERRVKLANMSNKVRQLGQYNAYTERQEGYKQADKRLDKSLEAQDKRYAQSNEEWNRRYGKQTDPEYIQKIADIEKEKQIAINKAKNAQEVATITKKYDAMLQYEKDKKDAGIGSTSAADQTHLNVSVNGVNQPLTKVQTRDQAYAIKTQLLELKTSNPEFYESLPANIKFMLTDPQAMTQAAADELVRYYYHKMVNDPDNAAASATTGTGGGKYTPTGDTTKAGKYTSGSK